MKKIGLLLMLAFVIGTFDGFSQNSKAPELFNGATADKESYKAIYIVNESDDKKIRGTLRNIKNALEDPRLKGKLTIELVAFGDGVELFKQINGYDTLLTALQNKGVILAQCLNTIKERNISKDALWPFISYVPTGNGEIIIRQYQGWATVHP